MKKPLLILTLIVFCARSQELAEWTILTFMQANNDLNHLAAYSLSHMQAGVQNTNGVNVLVEWDHINTQIISRYKIIPGDMELVDTFSKANKKHHWQALIDSFAWAQENYPAKHYALILWDHGTGILDYEPQRNLTFEGRCIKRGILLDETKNTIYTNQDLHNCFFQIHKLLGKKIDIVMMDACYMQMLEVGYQIKDFANILIAAQEYESGEGLPYGLFIYNLTLKSGKMTPLELSKNVVQMYDLFYKNKQNHDFYTYSAIDLNTLEDIKSAIDKVINSVNDCKVCNDLNTYELIAIARANTQEFFWEDYIDLFCFFQTLQNHIDENLNKKSADKYCDALKRLKVNLIKCNEQISKAVIANVVGQAHPNSKGLSIYFPISEAIHESYFKTIFAQNSNWISFLKEFC